MNSRVVPVVSAALVLSLLALSGCSTTKRIYSAEYVGDRQVSLDWVIGERIERSNWDPSATGGVPPLAKADAMEAAAAVLDKHVADPADWPLATCELVELKPGCYGYSVVYARKPGFADNHAGDALVCLYVLFDGTVVAPVVTYSR